MPDPKDILNRGLPLHTPAPDFAIQPPLLNAEDFRRYEARRSNAKAIVSRRTPLFDVRSAPIFASSRMEAISEVSVLLASSHSLRVNVDAFRSRELATTSKNKNAILCRGLLTTSGHVVSGDPGISFELLTARTETASHIENEDQYATIREVLFLDGSKHIPDVLNLGGSAILLAAKDIHCIDKGLDFDNTTPKPSALTHALGTNNPKLGYFLCSLIECTLDPFTKKTADGSDKPSFQFRVYVIGSALYSSLFKTISKLKLDFSKP